MVENGIMYFEAPNRPVCNLDQYMTARFWCTRRRFLVLPRQYTPGLGEF